VDKPTVYAMMLCHGRPEMARRALECFAAQTYECKVLSVWEAPGSIGKLRNQANARAEADIIIHWDDDDWSHPNRIAEQVALLQSSGAECVGYNEMLFWRCPRGDELGASPKGCDTASHAPRDSGEAWLYTGPSAQYCLGTSMCYWRETWEQNPFEDTNAGCDDLYWHGRGLRMVAESSVLMADAQPRMIAAIHGGNTCAAIDPTSTDWRRMPEWDAYCSERMAL
jgi:hypothetical protein